jgi:hypothetical protein
MNLKNKIFSVYQWFIIINILLCIFYCFFFNPITKELLGDAPSYIDLAKQIFNLPNAPTYDLSGRSPLYSIIIGFFMLIFSENTFILPIVVFQYLLIFLTSWIIYKLLFLMSKDNWISFVAGTTSSLNLSTIFFAYTIATETVAIFLFTYTVYQILKYFKEKKTINVFFAGLFSALLVLDRFNTIGIPIIFIFVLMVFIIFRFEKKSIKRYLKDLFIIILPIIVILNGWAMYNFLNNRFYNIIPPCHTGQRWAIPATIKKENVVSQKNKEVLNIYLKHIEVQKQNGKVINNNKKGSLLENSVISKLNEWFIPDANGYYLYRSSEKELLEYYHLTETPCAINQLGKNLIPFYNEIAKQNRKQLFHLRLYSFLYTFKSNSTTIDGKANINLNKLPVYLLVSYKLIFIFIIIIVYAISIVHIFRIIFKKQLYAKFAWFTLYAFIWYFPLINFYANVMGDANRFKYPTESIIIGIFIFQITLIVRRLVKTNFIAIHT